MYHLQSFHCFSWGKEEKAYTALLHFHILFLVVDGSVVASACLCLFWPYDWLQTYVTGPSWVCAHIRSTDESYVQTASQACATTLWFEKLFPSLNRFCWKNKKAARKNKHIFNAFQEQIAGLNWKCLEGVRIGHAVVTTMLSASVKCWTWLKCRTRSFTRSYDWTGSSPELEQLSYLLRLCQKQNNTTLFVLSVLSFTIPDLKKEKKSPVIQQLR